MSALPKISLVVATFNSASMLAETVPHNLDAGFSEIVIIDGFSKDNTVDVIRELEERFKHRIIFKQIPKKGLANARNNGTANSTCELVMHAGPDNFFTSDTLSEMVRLCGEYSLVSCRTELAVVNGYLEKVHSIYKRRYRSGKQTMVGTPYLAKRELFIAFPFNEKMLNSDDTEFCDRLVNANKAIYRAEVACLETGFNGLPEIIERWMRWGRGDALFYREKSNKWTIRRKIKSLLHPFNAEIVDIKQDVSISEYIYILPFIVFVTKLRYAGWLRFLLFNK